jgi:glutathione S-transferase
MKLHWSPRSPFVRKVMMVAFEAGLFDRIEKVRSVAVRNRPNYDILKDSPVGRIPVLVLDNGTVLTGSYAICEYLDSLHEGRKLIPPTGEKKWRELELHGIADGLLDTLVFWRGELMVPAEQSRSDISDTCAVKVKTCLAWLEAKTPEFSNDDFGIGQITVGIALEYLDFRYAHLDWRTTHPMLKAWHLNFSERPSRIITEVINDE